MPPKKKRSPKARRTEKLIARYNKSMTSYEIDLKLWTEDFYEPIREAFRAVRNERQLSNFDVESFIPVTDDIDDRTYAYNKHWEYKKAIEPDPVVLLNVMKMAGLPKPLPPKRP